MRRRNVPLVTALAQRGMTSRELARQVQRHPNTTCPDLCRIVTACCTTHGCFEQEKGVTDAPFRGTGSPTQVHTSYAQMGATHGRCHLCRKLPVSGRGTQPELHNVFSDGCLPVYVGSFISSSAVLLVCRAVVCCDTPRVIRSSSRI